MFDLEVTGKLDNDTIDLMVSDRCGVPDFLDDMTSYKPVVKAAGLKGGPVAFVASLFILEEVCESNYFVK